MKKIQYKNKTQIRKYFCLYNNNSIIIKIKYIKKLIFFFLIFLKKNQKINNQNNIEVNYFVFVFECYVQMMLFQ